MTADDPSMLTVAEWLARRPSQADSVREEVEPFRHMSPEQRLEWFVRLQKSMDAFVRLRGPAHHDEDDDFWRRWCNPLHGLPR